MLTKADELTIKLKLAAVTYGDHPVLSEMLSEAATEMARLCEAVEFARAEGVDWPSDPMPLADVDAHKAN